MTPWLTSVHETMIIEGSALTSTQVVARFGHPPEGTLPASKQLRDARSCGYFTNPPARTKHKEALRYKAVDRVLAENRSPTAEEYLCRMGPVTSIFDLGRSLSA